ncbi:hypothetical protein NMH_1621 [Neisseria meningitidis H44/76]|uniref:Uncharacterized protein n=1 Tax=Neisseria meningitidis serogroup B / serotype 15 (strain H44/76) TaxID=909420 RepID=E6MY75_NEIMH|nr:hypothetical protein NMH_1621 [Neisseria meningitidis H44/76]
MAFFFSTRLPVQTYPLSKNRRNLYNRHCLTYCSDGISLRTQPPETICRPSLQDLL